MSEVLLKEDNLLDLGCADPCGNVLFEVTSLIEERQLQAKPVRVNMGDLEFSQSQLENLLSVLKGFEIEIEMLYSGVKETKIAAIDLGLTVSGQKFCQEQQNEQDTEISGEDALENLLWQESNPEERNTLYIKQTLRSGQRLEHDGNLVIIGDCNAGSEVIASGDILVWGILSGLAHAGSKGDSRACIRAFKINAIQLRIADLLARRPDRLDIDRLERTELFNPEEARVSDGEIVIYSLHQDDF